MIGLSVKWKGWGGVKDNSKPLNLGTRKALVRKINARRKWFRGKLPRWRYQQTVKKLRMQTSAEKSHYIRYLRFGGESEDLVEMTSVKVAKVKPFGSKILSSFHLWLLRKFIPISGKRKGLKYVQMWDSTSEFSISLVTYHFRNQLPHLENKTYANTFLTELF